MIKNIKQTKMWLFLRKKRGKIAQRRNYKKAKKMKMGQYENYLKQRTISFFNRFDYSRNFGYVIDFSKPTTYTEKCQWLKLYDQDARKTIYSDKYLVREHIEGTIGSSYLIPLIKNNGKDYFTKVSDINFKLLPDQCVIKCTHGSHMNIIIKNKNDLTRKMIKKYKRQLKKWMRINYAYYVGLELQYRDIEPGIVIEKYMQNEQEDSLSDYKVYCYNGKPTFIAVHKNRGNKDYTETFLDLDFNILPFSFGRCPLDKDIEKPKELSEIIQLSKILSENFSLVRVDFYIINHKVYFGELTFSPGAGFEFPNPMSYDLKLGDLIEIDLSKRGEGCYFTK